MHPVCGHLLICNKGNRKNVLVICYSSVPDRNSGLRLEKVGINILFLAWIATVASETAFRFMVIVTTSCPILTIVDVNTAARLHCE